MALYIKRPRLDEKRIGRGMPSEVRDGADELHGASEIGTFGIMTWGSAATLACRIRAVNQMTPSNRGSCKK